eukprot:6100669-Pleurochrysis_carterae.AAC.1
MTRAERSAQRKRAGQVVLPVLSMPAAEAFGIWGVAEAVRGATGERPRAVIAIGDCDPAAAAFNAAS